MNPPKIPPPKTKKKKESCLCMYSILRWPCLKDECGRLWEEQSKLGPCRADFDIKEVEQSKLRIQESPKMMSRQ